MRAGACRVVKGWRMPLSFLNCANTPNWSSQFRQGNTNEHIHIIPAGITGPTSARTKFMGSLTRLQPRMNSKLNMLAPGKAGGRP